MKLSTLSLLFALIILSNASKEDHWAVLVAGSNGYWNYRHQADICHAYQIVKKNGIPEDQIIVFAYDDIASNSQNPFPGKIFNKPDGDDVYAGCKIDYKGSDVTPAKFLSVIKGEGSGKVLKSNSKSKVFINFSDHGAPGLIAFPSDELYAEDLHTAFVDMNQKQMYEEMTVYIEACESGSMFDKILEENINIYATTAANPTESSWATYCSPDDTVQGTHIGSCLGDEYSVNWMEDTDAHESKICSYSLSSQFDAVKQSTHDSHVMEYGDVKFKSEAIGAFQGTCDATSAVGGFLKQISDAYTPTKKRTSIDSRFAKMDYLYHKYMRTQSIEDADALEAEIANRRKIEERFEDIRSKANIVPSNNSDIKDFACYKQLVNSYKGSCGLDEYDLGFLHNFVSMCNSGMNSNDMISLVKSNC